MAKAKKDQAHSLGSGNLLKNQTFQVLIAIVLGIAVGAIWPDAAVAMKPLGDGFIRMIKMVIAPIIFLTIVTGISHVGDMKKVGKIGGKALIYFEVITTCGLILGMLAMNVFQPGTGFDTEHMAKADISKYVNSSQHLSFSEFLLNVIPDNAIGALAGGDLLQVLFVSIIFGIALAGMGPKAEAISTEFDKYLGLIFRVMGMIMKLAPIGAFGAMTFTIGKFGLHSLIPLGKLLLVAMGSMAVFIVVILGTVSWYYKFSLWRFIRYIEDELVIVLGTGSSEPVLPRMLEKMQKLGCSKPVVGLVIPTGYSFNLAGTSIYLPMCVLFIAQAYHIDMPLTDQIYLLCLLLLTSKGAAGVAGSAFVVLASTVMATHVLPVEGLALLLGIDRFMSSVRAFINVIGNGVATIVIAKTEKEFDAKKAVAEYQDYFQDGTIKSF